MSAVERPLPRQRTLEAWATALQQQSRVWLPLELPSQNRALVVFSALAPVGSSLWFVMLMSVEIPGVWAAVSSLVVGCVFVGAFLASRRAQRRRESCGWDVDFQQLKFSPVGLPEFSAIEVGPDYSLGCYGGGGDHDSGMSFQLELRHARKGPMAALTVIHMSRCGPAELRILDHCVSHLAERLGIRRSGAPLSAQYRPTRNGRK